MRWILLSVLFLLAFLLSHLPAHAVDNASVEELKLMTDGELCFDMILLCVANTADAHDKIKTRFYVIRARHHGKAPAWATKLYLVGIGADYSKECHELVSLCPSGK